MIKKSILAVLLLVTMSSTLVQAAPQSSRVKEQNDLELIQGLWQLESRKNSGIAKSDGIVKETTCQFDSRRMSMVEGDFEAIKADIEIFQESNPKRIVLTIAEGPVKGKQIEGIYKVIGNYLTICVSVGGPPPTSFSAPSGSTNEILNFRRDKEIELDASDDVWHNVELPGKVSVGMPTEAETRTGKVESGSGTLTTEFYTSASKELKFVCQVSVIDVEPMAAKKPSTIVAQIDLIVKDDFFGGSKIESHKVIQLHACDASEMTFTFGQDNVGKGVSRSIIVGQRVYVLTAMGRSDDSSLDKNVKRFFDSLNLMNQKRFPCWRKVSWCAGIKPD